MQDPSRQPPPAYNAGGFSAPYPPQQPPAYPQQPGYPPPGAAAYQPPHPHPQQGYGAFQGPNPAGMMAGQNAAFRTQAMGGYDSDVEGGGYQNADAMGNAFGDQAIRRGFIRKVYGILSIQLAVTCAIMAPFLFHNGAKQFARQNSWLMYIAFGITFACMIAMACCESVRRKSPTNYIFLGIFTVCEGFTLGVIGAFYDTESVMIAAGACAAVTLGLTLFAFQTKWDFTTCGGMLCAMMVILFFAGFLMIFIRSKIAVILYGSAGAIIFSLYIVYDTQLMLGGKHKYSISPEEYIFAALSLYLDIVNLFLYILTIVGAARGD